MTAMRKVDGSGLIFTSRTLLAGFEGGAIYTAESGGKFYLIKDEGAAVDLLDEEDRAGLKRVTYLEFDTAEERLEYANRYESIQDDV